MLQETRAYFAEMLSRDLSITHLIDSDFAFLNGRLARHYAGDNQTMRPSDKEKKRQSATLPVSWSESLIVSAPKPGDGLQKVTLASQSKRGGLVTQGAILKVTADGTSTSPVVRGVFINERILGNHIPPPPPGIPAIEPDIRGATSIRDQLDKHRNNESCASCHQTIDPPGFALENYDPVGLWRSAYGKTAKEPKSTPPAPPPKVTSLHRPQPPGRSSIPNSPSISPAASLSISSPTPPAPRHDSVMNQRSMTSPRKPRTSARSSARWF
jgi:hypothetical protein